MAVGTLVKMKVLGLDHIHFTVRDLEEALAFYKKLGFKLERRLDHDGESAQLRISPGGVVIDIHLAKTVENPGYNHFAVSGGDGCRRKGVAGSRLQGRRTIRRCGYGTETRHYQGS